MLWFYSVTLVACRCPSNHHSASEANADLVSSNRGLGSCLKQKQTPDTSTSTFSVLPCEYRVLKSQPVGLVSLLSNNATWDNSFSNQAAPASEATKMPRARLSGLSWWWTRPIDRVLQGPRPFWQTLLHEIRSEVQWGFVGCYVDRHSGPTCIPSRARKWRTWMQNWGPEVISAGELLRGAVAVQCLS